MNFSGKTNRQIDQWISNHEEHCATGAPLYLALLEERVRRAQATQKLSFERSLDHLRRVATEQRCTTYGALAAASGVEWSSARHQMSGAHGHLDRLLDICHVKRLPLLTAICVNQSGAAKGELGEEALEGFANGARRLGISVGDPLAFHHQCRDACWAWGREQQDACAAV
ncbi:hypothetical protein [Sphingomonas oligophenolica]|uniref:Uncharacterized protein n=1 Tax=Sphingomonas oligophenolica TaxID=301154 RepID=A0A502CQ58_9SPHN|nr:hypothetical protein [Sphingomonas oligophenolica]TPG15357.1 hypothetical protein EAH84_00665 [Sphingomonas oligophenolica]